MSSVKKVLIVGGGIGGQSAAIALAKDGVSVEIAERLEAYNVYGVGIIQQANALKALDKIGIADEAMKRGFPYGQVKMFTAGGHAVGVAGPPPMGKYPSHNGVSRRILHDVMYEEAIKRGVNYRMGLTVKTIENNEDHVSVVFTDGTEGVYDILIAADGIKSEVRKMVFGDYKPQYMGLSVWRYAFKKHEDLDTGYIYYGKRSKIGFIPMSEDSMYMFLVSSEGADNPWIEKSAYISMLKDYLSEYPVKIVNDVIGQITEPDLVNYRPLEATHLPNPWYKNRVIIIGDAAHATVPQLGSGAALAIEDAVVLSEELKSNVSVEDTFKAFMKRRYDRCMMVVNASETLAAWELLEFQGKPLPEGAHPGKLIGQAVGGLMAPF
ncbi:FAD-dependent monooxygenase [Confluentibacter flavum]|uniref:Monooxygenase n=1 Tax=Confluentibacter flavum TaxID=1909700 RepID=A0A2N3HI29_9FLAO|nr:FAD-dependent monooxygenase [Confluentibacter flavum]PKQ44553.1 monooxygenase [Confluentibacter flavum]